MTLSQRALAVAVLVAAGLPAVAHASPVYINMPDERISVLGRCEVHVGIRDMGYDFGPPGTPGVWVYPGYTGAETDCP